jgi:CHAT domain-containing protein
MSGALAASADRLDGLLFDGLRATIGDRALVVIPTGALHLLPWPALPSCRGRAVAVAPSAGIWLQAATRPTGENTADNGITVLAAGPGVAHARQELLDLAEIYPAARRLSGSAATARSVASALDGASLAHVIAHGTFRADNPLFSSLRLADGPLTVYELERLSQAPRRVVLSACNAGLAAVRPGNELMGVSSALFALGTTTLVASVLLVGDRETGRLMVDFHRNLAKGLDAPSALADAQVRAGAGDPRAGASASSFICLGA